MFRGFPFQNFDPTCVRADAIYARYITAFSLLRLIRVVYKFRIVWPCGGTPYMVSIAPVFHTTIRTCFKRVKNGGYEFFKKWDVLICIGHELANAIYLHNTNIS